MSRNYKEERPTRKQGTKESEGKPPSSDWVDRIHGNHGPYPCYAIPLLPPFDENVRQYVKNKSPVDALVRQRNKEEFRRKGQWIISEICEIAGMSIGKAVEIFLGAWFGS